MSSRLAATRPFLGVLALAATLALTSCSGGQAQQTGTSAGDGPASSAPAAAEASGNSEAEPVAGATPDATDGSGTPVPTGKPAEEAAPEPADEPVRSPAAGTPAGAPGADGGSAGAAGGGSGSAAGGRSDATAGGDSVPRWCSAAQLEMVAAPAGGAAGSVWVDLTATNTGGSPCTLAGYPGVSFVDGSGAMVGLPAVRDANTPGTGQVVAPGQSVTAALRVSQTGNHPTCDARTVTGLRVYPPESTESTVLPFPAQACADTRVQQLEIQGFGA